MNTGEVALYCSSGKQKRLERNILRLMELFDSNGKIYTLALDKNSNIHEFIDYKQFHLFDTGSFAKPRSIFSSWKISRKLIRSGIKTLIIFRPGDLLVGIFARLLSAGSMKLIYYQSANIEINKRKLIYWLAFKQTDAWITPFEFLLENTYQQCGSQLKQGFVISPGIRINNSALSEFSSRQARIRLELPVGRKIMGIMGIHNPQKKQDFLIRAIKFLQLNNYPIDLLIMGRSVREEDEEYSKFLPELVKECNLEEQVHFRPFADNKALFYKSIDLFIRTTNGDSCDISIQEAMAYGVPVIAAHSELNDTLLDHGRNGLLFKSNNLEDFAAKAIRLITQNKIADHLCVEGQRIVKEKYDAEKEFAQFESLFERLKTGLRVSPRPK